MTTQHDDLMALADEADQLVNMGVLNLPLLRSVKLMREMASALRLAASRSAMRAAEAALGGWTYEIQHGPDREAAYAWVFDNEYLLVCTAKIHHAKSIVDRMNAAAPKSPDISAEEMRERCAAVCNLLADEIMKEAEAAHDDEDYDRYEELECRAADYQRCADRIRQLPTAERARSAGDEGEDRQ